MVRFNQLSVKTITRRWCQGKICIGFETHVLKSPFPDSARSEFSVSWAARPFADERVWWVDMSTRGTSGKDAVDGSVGDGTPPVSSLTIHHFVSELLYLKTAFCITAFDKALAPADRSRYAPAPPIEKLICGVIRQPILRLCQTVTRTRHPQIK